MPAENNQGCGTRPSQAQIKPSRWFFSDNYKRVGKDGNPVAGKPKGTEYVLAERSLLSAVEAAAKSRGGKVVDTCEVCRASG